MRASSHVVLGVAEKGDAPRRMAGRAGSSTSHLFGRSALHEREELGEAVLRYLLRDDDLGRSADDAEHDAVGMELLEHRAGAGHEVAIPSRP